MCIILWSGFRRNYDTLRELFHPHMRIQVALIVSHTVAASVIMEGTILA